MRLRWASAGPGTCMHQQHFSNKDYFTFSVQVLYRCVFLLYEHIYIALGSERRFIAFIYTTKIFCSVANPDPDLKTVWKRST